MTNRDPLTDVLDMLRVRGAVMGHLRAHSPWGLRIAHTQKAVFHAVSAGTCWVRVAGHEPRELAPGDVVLLPTGASHIIASSPDGPARLWNSVTKQQAQTKAGEILLDGPGGHTRIICAAYDYDFDVAHPLLSLLPPVLFVSAADTPGAHIMRTTLAALGHELSARPAAWGTVIDRFIDVLFVYVIREWLAQDKQNETSWLGALRDPGISRVLAAMHANPSAPWTVELLARETNLSRATLTRRFASLVGEAPLSYLTRWRMDVAAQQLRETDDAVSTIAHRVGYTSEFAFSRAFTRMRGDAPRRYRMSKRRASTEFAST